MKGICRIFVLLFVFSALPHAFAEMPVQGGEAPAAYEGERSGEKVYRIHAGDKVKITIYPEDQYVKGGEMEVSTEGNITLSLIGKVYVEGRTAVEIERELVEIIDRDYLVDPEVVLEVTEKYAKEEEKSVVLLGQVRSPGTYPFPKNERFTLLQAIALAGGFSDIANIKKIKVIRGGEDSGNVVRANAEDIITGRSPDVELQNGDIIHVTESLF